MLQSARIGEVQRLRLLATIQTVCHLKDARKGRPISLLGRLFQSCPGYVLDKRKGKSFTQKEENRYCFLWDFEDPNVACSYFVTDVPNVVCSYFVTDVPNVACGYFVTDVPNKIQRSDDGGTPHN